MNRYLLLIVLLSLNLFAMENREDQTKDSAYQAGYLLADVGFKLFLSNVTGEFKKAHEMLEKQTYISEKYSLILLNDSLPVIEEYIKNIGELDRIKKEDAFLTGFTSYYRMMGIFLMENNEICFVPKEFLHVLTSKKEQDPHPNKDRFLTNYHGKLRKLETDMRNKFNKEVSVLNLEPQKRLILIKNNFRYIE